MALAMEKENYAKGGKYLGYVKNCKALTEWRHSKEFAYLKEAPIHALQQSLKNLDASHKRCFDKTLDAKYPKFKKKGQHDSFHYPDHFKLDENNTRVYLPKIGWVRYRKSQNINGKPKNMTVSFNCGHWYVSIQTEQEVETPVHAHADLAVGIDMGVVNLATLSDGTVVKPVNALKKYADKLAHAQRKLKRMKKGSHRWRKQVSRIARIHHRIACVRNDALNKATTAIAKNHGIVVVEALKVKNMNKSARGTVENPGRNVRQKAGLNRSILDQGWYEFKRQLGYKLAWRGGKLVEVPAPFTSQRCSVCGHTEAANRPSQAMFRCMACGHTENADLNAAKNILAAGQAVMARGGEETQVAPLKREPAWRAVA